LAVSRVSKESYRSIYPLVVAPGSCDVALLGVVETQAGFKAGLLSLIAPQCQVGAVGDRQPPCARTLDQLTTSGYFSAVRVERSGVKHSRVACNISGVRNSLLPL